MVRELLDIDNWPGVSKGLGMSAAASLGSPLTTWLMYGWPRASPSTTWRIRSPWSSATAPLRVRHVACGRADFDLVHETSAFPRGRPQV